jgi:hypothetical protein
MKTYRGRRCDRRLEPHRVEVVEEGRTRPLVHQCLHSPDGFEWGYGGSGPADLARSILADVLGRIPPPYLYQNFKRDHIAIWGDEWSITEEEIRTWLAKQREGGEEEDADEVGGL